MGNGAPQCCRLGTWRRIGAGTYQGNLASFFDGRLDGVRYSEGARYDSTFTPTTAPAADTDTIGLWTFDEATGTTTATAGQMTGNATLVNGPIWAEGPIT